MEYATEELFGKDMPKEVIREHVKAVQALHEDPSKEVEFAIVDPQQIPGRPKTLQNEVVVAFRGMIASFEWSDFLPWTDPTPCALNRHTLLGNTELTPTSEHVPCDGGKAARGMVQYFQKVEQELLRQLTHLLTERPAYVPGEGPLPVTITGFSLGAPLAAQCGLLLRNLSERLGVPVDLKVVIFASPKLGDRTYCEYLHDHVPLQAYWTRGDCIATHPNDRGYGTLGSCILLERNTCDWKLPGGEVPKAVAQDYPAAKPTVVSNHQMSLMTRFGKPIPIPSWDSINVLAKYHRIWDIHDLLKDEPCDVLDLVNFDPSYQAVMKVEQKFCCGCP